MANPEVGRRVNMGVKIKFMESQVVGDTDFDEVTEDGRWRYECPRRYDWTHRVDAPHKCELCNHTGYVTVDPIPLRDPCKPEDHQWHIEAEEGSLVLYCDDEHSPIERQA